jgi:hypothetical protein
MHEETSGNVTTKKCRFTGGKYVALMEGQRYASADEVTAKAKAALADVSKH